MPVPIEQRYQSLRAVLQRIGQAHVLSFWKDLSEAYQQALLEDLARIDLDQIPRWRKLILTGRQEGPARERLEPVRVFPRESVRNEIIDRGKGLLSQGRVAALTVAGGQGARLGFDGPKGSLPISPVKNKTLYQLFAESILATERRYRTRVPWYIMTSPSTHDQTQSFFDANDFFGLSQEQIRLFQQGVVPVFDEQGDILLDQRHRVAFSPDGHGGVLRALVESGLLYDMAERGIDYISYFQVDNPLVACLDPAFLGMHETHHSEMSSKTVSKADDLERVGNFVIAEGRHVVIEYSDLPAALAHQRSEDGSRRFDASNIAVHILSRTFIERLTVDGSGPRLPWHLAKKKVPFTDPNSGNRVEPAVANAFKLETFIFDALPLAENPFLLGTARAEEFSPIKNPSGVDSIESARRDMSRRAARWLEAAGVDIPKDQCGESLGRYEISPLLALDSVELATWIRQRPESEPLLIQPNTDCYLEP